MKYLLCRFSFMHFLPAMGLAGYVYRLYLSQLCRITKHIYEMKQKITLWSQRFPFFRNVKKLSGSIISHLAYSFAQTYTFTKKSEATLLQIFEIPAYLPLIRMNAANFSVTIVRLPCMLCLHASPICAFVTLTFYSW